VFFDFLDGSSTTSYVAHMMQAIKYSAIAGVVFWLLLILLIWALDYGDPIDETKFPLPVQLIILFILLSQIVGIFIFVGLVVEGASRSFQFVKRQLTSSRE